ncbi:MAG: PAS domain S-box protein [Myxococcales bacterium]|nr:PAS domain S-box protein [Myxococcales bacterium]MCB9553555.1 PAS domain S-box protein [Myxococcales bacterium]
MDRANVEPAVKSARRSPPPPPEIVAKLQWLMFFRVVIITLLLGSSLLFRIIGADFAANPTQLILLGVIIVTYALTIIYALVLRALRGGYERFAYLQLVIDQLISAVLVSITGGTESLFLILYALTILNASILLYRRGAMYMMALATALVVFQVAREALGWWLPGGPVSDSALLAVFLSGVTNVSAVFLVALLAGYLSEQLRDAGRRLKVASRDLESARAINERIIQSIQSGLVAYTLEEDDIIFFNPAAARITGFDAAAVLYTPVHAVFQKLPAGEDPLARWEADFTRPDGQRRVLGYSRSPLLDGAGRQRGWILAFQDLTPLREMQQSVRRSERLAAIGKMAAGIAHEIRNPLASMSGSIQMLRDTIALDPMGERLMNIVLRETDRLNALITDFLQFARPNPPQIESIDLRALLEELIQVFGYLRHPTEGEAPRGSEVQLDAPAELRLDADPRQLKQVFWNLLNNATQALGDDGEVRLVARRRGDRVTVAVIDTGAGIPSEALDRIFDPFYSTKEQGTGLGLAQVLRIVEEHGGRIDVQSVVGAGSTFTVEFPVAHRPAPPASSERGP